MNFPRASGLYWIGVSSLFVEKENNNLGLPIYPTTHGIKT
jgi:hypothetical protein